MLQSITSNTIHPAVIDHRCTGEMNLLLSSAQLEKRRQGRRGCNESSGTGAGSCRSLDVDGLLVRHTTAWFSLW